ncbi:MAG: SGNH/GDSL hydrolase family protein [Oscillospiraceae bacterium]
MIKENSKILFQGDSITDAGRTYDVQLEGIVTPCELGIGYPNKVKEFLDTFFKDKNITVLNRGISGNRTIDLRNRWDKDCIDLKPDYLSILIGVNDTWRRYDANDSTCAEEYEANFRHLLQRAKDELNCEIIILEPFLIPTDRNKDCWYEDLIWKIQVARKLAREFGATFISLDGAFASKCTEMEPSYWSLDGVHPTDAGHSFIARLWLDTMLKG